MKYRISYTLKNPNGPGIYKELFKTKKAAKLWLKENSEKLYWHQLAEINPKSKLPKPVVLFEPGEEFSLKIGTLNTYEYYILEKK